MDENTKINKLKELGYFEVDLDFLEKYMDNEKFNNKIKQRFRERFYSIEVIMARNVGGTIVFYGRKYIEKNSIEELLEKANRFDSL